jgi:hypothetical protein
VTGDQLTPGGILFTNQTSMHRTVRLLISLFIGLFASFAHAQSAQQDTLWLKQQLNQLVLDDEPDIKPVFSFQACQMRMVVDTKQEGIKVKMNLNWPLGEVRKVSYQPTPTGRYTLKLDIPANKVKGKMKIGFFSKRLRPKGEDGQSNFDLNTNDEQLMRRIQQQFESVIARCKNEK